MKKTSFLISTILFLVIIFSLNSCAPAYTPNVVNVPLLTNKNEVQASLSVGTSGTDAQLAYALTNHIGLMTNWNYRNNRTDTSDSYHYHNFIEGGIGYYTSFSSQGRFELYGGYGFGNVDIFYDLTSTILQAKFKRLYVQPNFGFSSSYFDIGFSPRLVYVIMKPSSLQYSTINRFFIEPTETMRLGFKTFYFTSQFGFAIPLNLSESGSWFKFKPLIISLGIQIKLFKIYDSNSIF